MGKSQREMVLDYLLNHEMGMTSLDAQRKFGIMQMPKRIFDLRKDGWIIKSRPETGKNRFGEKVSYVRYICEGKQR